MKAINFSFYSHKPRLAFDITFKTELIPSIGDVVEIPKKFIGVRDKKYFKEWNETGHMHFKVIERMLILDKSNYNYDVYDMQVVLDWLDDEKNKINERTCSKVKCIKTNAGGHDLPFLTLGKEYDVIHNSYKRMQSLKDLKNEREFGVIDDNGKLRRYSYHNPSRVWEFIK